jgi:hypothetical protein
MSRKENWIRRRQQARYLHNKPKPGIEMLVWRTQRVLTHLIRVSLVLLVVLWIFF